jgi:hypothetical protein
MPPYYYMRDDGDGGGGAGCGCLLVAAVLFFTLLWAGCIHP